MLFLMLTEYLLNQTMSEQSSIEEILFRYLLQCQFEKNCLAIPWQ